MIVASLVGFAVLSLAMIRLVGSSMFELIIDSTSSVVRIGFTLSLVGLQGGFSASVVGLSLMISYIFSLIS